MVEYAFMVALIATLSILLVGALGMKAAAHLDSGQRNMIDVTPRGPS